MSDQYRENAFRCVRLAQASSNSESKLVLLMMARGWINMGELSADRFPSKTDAAKVHPGLEIATS
jgi:hypothetical protein